MAEARDSSGQIEPAVFRMPPPQVLPDGRYNVTVVYLEMTRGPAPNAPNPPPLVPKLALMKLEKPTTGFYRYLYDTVGRPWHWVDRHRLSDVALGQIICDPRVEIWVPYVGGVPAGYIELDRREETLSDLKPINIAYFGLAPEFFSRGLGPWLLRTGIGQAFFYGTQRLTVNTCNLDHPAALPLYQKVGFRPYQTREAVFDPRY
ncbi:MAG TPA: GNAT family N-acetyltransferase [Ferrovibrio sp.]|uniref:GNAT family N-acetyltransferase n=1 Tax=Ferrovibrio sp. TaxID=1917215 RepID=UPI002ED40EF3